MPDLFAVKDVRSQHEDHCGRAGMVWATRCLPVMRESWAPSLPPIRDGVLHRRTELAHQQLLAVLDLAAQNNNAKREEHAAEYGNAEHQTRDLQLPTEMLKQSAARSF
jgi:hypothetical protein